MSKSSTGGSVYSKHKPKGRRIFVGDIQGCRDELERLLDELRFDPAADELHPVGDLVNRGPDSRGVLRLCRKLDAGGVLGNHDLHLLRVAAGTRELGSRDTLQDVLGAKDRDKLCSWLARRPFVRVWDDLLCVHAALNPTWSDPIAELAGLDALASDPRIEFVTRARYCTAEGKLPASDDPPPKPPFVPWFLHLPKLGLAQKTVVFGHWSRMGLVAERGVRGLDTGCVWGRKLTAWVAEEDLLVSVPARRVYSRMSRPKGGLPPGSRLD